MKVKRIFSFVVVFVLLLSMGGLVYAATIGQPLASPETGWQRIDDPNTNITYTASWSIGSMNGSYPNGLLHYTNTKGSQSCGLRQI